MKIKKYLIKIFLAEIYILKIILKFCKIKNLKLKILSSLSHLDKEANLFENILGKKILNI